MHHRPRRKAHGEFFSFFRRRPGLGLMPALLLASSAWAQDASEQLFRSGFHESMPHQQAVAFLDRATFGATPESVAELQRLGPEGWIDVQLALPASLHYPAMTEAIGRGVNDGQVLRQHIWWDRVQHAPDQLRQRMAFALSEILVVSDQNGSLEGRARGLANYYDLLLEEAFGNYRDLLERVTLSPIMGTYLSMRGSTRFAEAGIEPDENYAREIMQLFSIGLVMLNPDGTLQLDGEGEPIPTYTQPEIIGLAEAFTGWNYAGTRFRDPNADEFCQPWEWQYAGVNDFEPLEPCPIDEQFIGGDGPRQPPNYHVTTEKTIVGGVVLPAGQTIEQDLAMALDTLFQHPNVGPFLATRLIQRLVSSNPSPAYVARVAAVFADNGSGVRGDLAAVLRAILLDPEARAATAGNPDFGKLREPLLRVTHLWRAYDAQRDPTVELDEWVGLIVASERFLGQAALRSPSVFNFFQPDYAQPGPIQDAGLVAPEFQISTETFVTSAANLFYETLVPSWTWPPDYPWQTRTHLQLDGLLALADRPDRLLARLDNDLLGGRMSIDLWSRIRGRLQEIDPANRRQRVTEAIYFIMASPDYVVQK